MKDQRRLFQS